MALTATVLALAGQTGSDTAVAQEQADCGLYEYRADIRRVVDGDTVDADNPKSIKVMLAA